MNKQYISFEKDLNNRYNIIFHSDLPQNSFEFGLLSKPGKEFGWSFEPSFCSMYLKEDLKIICDFMEALENE